MRSDLKLLAVLAAVLLALGLSACGSGSPSSSDPSTASAETSTEPSSEFVGKGPNGELATAGKEASEAEREAASKVVEESFNARAAGDWAGQCETLSGSALKHIEYRGGMKGDHESCLQALEAEAKETSKAVLKNTMTEPLAALRVNGDQAFAFYHGASDKDYVVPMEKESDGTWKVAALLSQEVP